MAAEPVNNIGKEVVLSGNLVKTREFFLFFVVITVKLIIIFGRDTKERYDKSMFTMERYSNT